jgi:hypothetical protein
MMILPGPQGLTSRLWGVHLFNGTLFQLGLLEVIREFEGKALVEVEAEYDDGLDDPALLSLSSSRSTVSRAAFSVWMRTRGSTTTFFPSEASFAEDALERFVRREEELEHWLAMIYLVWGEVEN